MQHTTSLLEPLKIRDHRNTAEITESAVENGIIIFHGKRVLVKIVLLSTKGDLLTSGVTESLFGGGGGGGSQRVGQTFIWRAKRTASQ